MERFYHKFQMGGYYTPKEVKILREQIDGDTEFALRIPRTAKKALAFEIPEAHPSELKDLWDYLIQFLDLYPERALMWHVLPQDEYVGIGRMARSFNGDKIDNHMSEVIVKEVMYGVDADNRPTCSLETLLHQDERDELIQTAEFVFSEFPGFGINKNLLLRTKSEVKRRKIQSEE